ncbi:hypothetical protein [Marimonas arenosa]|nr:hypothetical protein [Marimonas arenosa]
MRWLGILPQLTKASLAVGRQQKASRTAALRDLAITELNPLQLTKPNVQGIFVNAFRPSDGDVKRGNVDWQWQSFDQVLVFVNEPLWRHGNQVILTSLSEASFDVPDCSLIFAP